MRAGGEVLQVLEAHGADYGFASGGTAGEHLSSEVAVCEPSVLGVFAISAQCVLDKECR